MVVAARKHNLLLLLFNKKGKNGRWHLIGFLSFEMLLHLPFDLSLKGHHVLMSVDLTLHLGHRLDVRFDHRRSRGRGQGLSGKVVPDINQAHALIDLPGQRAVRRSVFGADNRVECDAHRDIDVLRVVDQHFRTGVYAHHCKIPSVIRPGSGRIENRIVIRQMSYESREVLVHLVVGRKPVYRCEDGDPLHEAVGLYETQVRGQLDAQGGSEGLEVDVIGSVDLGEADGHIPGDIVLIRVEIARKHSVIFNPREKGLLVAGRIKIPENVDVRCVHAECGMAVTLLPAEADEGPEPLAEGRRNVERNEKARIEGELLIGGPGVVAGSDGPRIQVNRQLVVRAHTAYAVP